ncbi:MAG: MaoC family dehydratase [Chloroflexi bacterium]|nr:MaoC family dehydratase [Chloroflexota bacterium]
MAKAARDLQVGYELPTLTRTMTQELMTKYGDGILSVSAGKFTPYGVNIHTDAEYAKSQGLPAPVADGMVSTCWLSEMLTDFFGEGFLVGGRLLNKYIKLVFAGDVLTMKATITKKEQVGSAVRYEMDVACVNQKGEPVTVGTATAWVR